VLIDARRGPWWDAGKVGLGPPPILTDLGWLIMYHGVRTTAAGAIYRLGLALADRNDPGRLIMRSGEWIFGPEADYERAGDVPGVVFPFGSTTARPTPRSLSRASNCKISWITSTDTASAGSNTSSARPAPPSAQCSRDEKASPGECY
jgi:hypothetical protein